MGLDDLHKLTNNDHESKDDSKDGSNDGMEQLFRRAVSISNANPNNQKEILSKHVNEIMELMCIDYGPNIMTAASNGSKRALIAIYQVDAKYRNVMPIHDMLFPSASLATKYKTFAIKNLLLCLEEKFSPFGITIVPITQLLNSDLKISDSTKKWMEDVKAVIVNWR
jgi:hypothetical protein